MTKWDKSRLITLGALLLLTLAACNGGGGQTVQPQPSPASVEVIAPTPIGAEVTSPALAPVATPSP